MQCDMPISVAIPSLLATQLLAAEVYSHFLSLSSDLEAALWKKMLLDEMEHAEHLKNLLDLELPRDLTVPYINVERVREMCEQVGMYCSETFLLRLEGALRLESAELDYGLEGFTAKKLCKSDLVPDYPGDVNEHVGFLLAEAERYSESPNIGLQIIRVKEILDTSMAETAIYPSPDEEKTDVPHAPR